MIIYTPIYNEMPWTPYFLKHLLEFDCPIIIGEGASESRQQDNDRSWDGSWELIQFFANRWKDRVTVYLHDYNLNTHNPNDRTTRTAPREAVKMKAWNQAIDGEWIVGLSVDNFYTSEDIIKIKQTCIDSQKNDYLLMTGVRVFAFNFQTVCLKTIPSICTQWFSLWPCIWRKNDKYVLFSGDELLTDKNYGVGSGHHLVRPSIQKNPKQKFQHVIIRQDINQFHYQSVKKYTNRIQRFESKKIAKIFMNYPLITNDLKTYNGPHPKILDTHPWRYTKDSRKEKPEFNWQDYIDLVTKV